MTNTPDVKQVYRRKEVVDYYATTDALMPAETYILDRYRSAIAGKSVLDIGIGTGRTTPHLLALTKHYVGIDYSPEMVARAAQLQPQADVRVGDARDLGSFGKEVDFVLFSFNGIDSVSHADRLVVLREISSVLRPGGMLAFSSHSLGGPRKSAFNLANLPLSPNPVRLLRGIRWYALGIFNHLRARHAELRTPGYALLTERATRYRGLNYYVSKAFQVAQLEHAGFQVVEIINEKAQPTRVTDDDRDRWTYYVARKPT